VSNGKGVKSPTTTAEYIKAQGFRSGKQAADLLETTTETLRDWHKTHPRRFEIAILGAAEYLKRAVKQE
jgi:hypothetical protein